jgi:hypothetical protein
MPWTAVRRIVGRAGGLRRCDHSQEWQLDKAVFYAKGVPYSSPGLRALYHRVSIDCQFNANGVASCATRYRREW